MPILEPAALVAGARGSDRRGISLDPASPAIAVLTSGTTGTPKAALLSHAALAASALAWAAALPPATGWLLCLGLAHVAGLGVAWRAVGAGVPLHVVVPFDAGGVSAGRPLPGVAVRIAEPGPDGVGEIEVRTPAAFGAYLGREAATAAAFTPDGWLRTGDLGRLDAAARLFVADRRADLVVSGGENVYPAEVEAAVEGHPAVVEAGVAGRPDPTWGAVPVAGLVLRAGVARSRRRRAPLLVPRAAGALQGAGRVRAPRRAPANRLPGSCAASSSATPSRRPSWSSTPPSRRAASSRRSCESWPRRATCASSPRTGAAAASAASTRRAPSRWASTSPTSRRSSTGRVSAAPCSSGTATAASSPSRPPRACPSASRPSSPTSRRTAARRGAHAARVRPCRASDAGRLADGGSRRRARVHARRRRAGRLGGAAGAHPGVPGVRGRRCRRRRRDGRPRPGPPGGDRVSGHHPGRDRVGAVLRAHRGCPRRPDPGRPPRRPRRPAPRRPDHRPRPVAAAVREALVPVASGHPGRGPSRPGGRDPPHPTPRPPAHPARPDPTRPTGPTRPAGPAGATRRRPAWPPSAATRAPRARSARCSTGSAASTTR